MYGWWRFVFKTSAIHVYIIIIKRGGGCRKGRALISDSRFKDSDCSPGWWMLQRLSAKSRCDRGGGSWDLRGPAQQFSSQPNPRVCAAHKMGFSPVQVRESNAVREVDEQIEGWGGGEDTRWTDCGMRQQYLQAYVMEKLFPILTISTCGTSLGMSWWWERAKRKTSYSCDSVGNNPPVDQRIIGS